LEDRTLAEPFTRPVLTANDLGFITEGLDLYASQWRDAANDVARNADDEDDQMEAGMLLGLAIEVEDLQARLRGLLDTLVAELIDRQVANSLGEEDESLPTVSDEADIPLPEMDEVGTIPMDVYIPDPIDADNPER
jgi:hypothetical protein